jgi:SAM-dependent methyltransferase/alkylhydroperoxidase family enzyme
VGDLRAIFDEDAERYDRARPGYPDELFDDLCDLAHLGPGSRVLEIGCGTGQATVPLARRGFTVVAVELGAHLAAIARRNLAAYPDAQVVVSTFEAWPLPAEPFDAVVAFTAFHWIEPDVGLAKVAAALRPGGAFVVVTTDHVAGGTDPFFVEVQGCYERWDPDTPAGIRLPRADTIVSNLAPDPSGRFGPASERRYQTDIAYTTAAYVDVLLTYSNHRALARDLRSGLLECIASLIDTRYGGLIVKRHLRRLRVSYRRPSRGEEPMRIEQLNFHDLTPEQQQLYDAIASRRTGSAPPTRIVDEHGDLQGPFNAMHHYPALGHALQELGAVLRFGGLLPDRARELVILTVAAAWESEFEWWAHHRIGREIGLTDDEIAAVRASAPMALDDHVERAALDVARATTSRGDLDEGEYARAYDALGDRMLIEVLTLVGYYALLALQMRVHRVPLPEGATPSFAPSEE